MLLLASDRSLRSPWQYTVALCLLWLPPALSVGQLDGGPGPYSPWFYRFAILALLWLAGIAAYGIAAFAPDAISSSRGDGPELYNKRGFGPLR